MSKLKKLLSSYWNGEPLAINQVVAVLAVVAIASIVIRLACFIVLNR